MSERAPVAWVLNLDAEEELAARGRYAPNARLAALVNRNAARLAGVLVLAGDVVVDEHTPAGAARGLEGRAWSPTPRALALLAHAGARLPDAPALDVLRAVNARPFAAGVRAELGGEPFDKRVARFLDEALVLLERPAPLGWLVRRTFGAAGRGRMRIASGPPSEHERRWLAASVARGPLVVEPWVDVAHETTVSGSVSRSGAVCILAPCAQRTTRGGAWVATRRTGAGELARSDDERVLEAAEVVGERLARAGYFGPFGVDSFRYRAGGRAGLNPLSEINARWTMDWPVGRAAP